MTQSLKNIIKYLFPRSVIDHLIYLFHYRIFKRGYFAQSQLDKKLKKYINYNDGYFIELGANDGFTASNTLYFELKNWRGILIEPAPNLFISCTYYRDKPGNHLFCNACVPFDYQDKYVDIEYAYLMSVSDSLQKDIPDDFINNAKINLNKHQQELKFGAVARTLTSILDESNAPKKIDLISLDAEGAELPILKGIDFNKYKFKYLLIESRSIDELTTFLNHYNYFLVEKFSHHDYLFASK